MKHLRIFALAAACILLTGCSETAAADMRKQAALEYRYYPVTEQLSSTHPDDEALLARMDTYYKTMLESRRTQLAGITQPDREEPLNRIPEDNVLPMSRYSPTTALLFSEDASIHLNPVLIMKQILANMPETAVSESEIKSSTEKIDLPAGDVPHYTAPQTYISGCLRKNYCDMDYKVGFSESENLYYVYLFDTREALTVMAVYFKFGQQGQLERIGFDSVSYDPYEITLPEGSRFLALPIPEDPEDMQPYTRLKTLAVSMLGAVQSDMQPQPSQKPHFCEHTFDKQYYYAGGEASGKLLAVRLNDWYIIRSQQTGNANDAES